MPKAKMAFWKSSKKAGVGEPSVSMFERNKRLSRTKKGSKLVAPVFTLSIETVTHPANSILTHSRYKNQHQDEEIVDEDAAQNIKSPCHPFESRPILFNEIRQRPQEIQNRRKVRCKVEIITSFDCPLLCD